MPRRLTRLLTCCLACCCLLELLQPAVHLSSVFGDPKVRYFGYLIVVVVVVAAASAEEDDKCKLLSWLCKNWSLPRGSGRGRAGCFKGCLGLQ